METGTTSHLDRLNLTKRLDEMIKPFLEDCGFTIEEFGYNITLRDASPMFYRMKKLEVKKSEAALIVKFSPDFISIKRGKKKDLFFIETKASITPIFFESYIQRLRDMSGITDLKREDIGEIEREAWDTYNDRYPKEKVVIIMACPYNPKLLVAEKVSKINCFHRFKKDINYDAGGSKTPHVNIHLGQMRRLDLFLKDEYGVKINVEFFNEIIEFIKKWDINKPIGRVNWTQFNNCISKLKVSCPWLKHRLPQSKDQSLLDKYR